MTPYEYILKAPISNNMGCILSFDNVKNKQGPARGNCQVRDIKDRPDPEI